MADETTGTKKADDLQVDAILEEARERFHRALQADQTERDEALTDIQFVDGEGQWPAGMKDAREKKNRPCLTINQLPSFIDQTIGDQRQNKPSIKVKPNDERSDPEKADVLEGMMRSIENASQAGQVYDWGFECAVTCGRGFWRVKTDYIDDDSFEQQILLEEIGNPLSVVFDESCTKPFFEDADYVIVHTLISKEEFERKYPDKAAVSTDASHEYVSDWRTNNMIRIAEYWRRVHDDPKTIYLLANGEVVDELPEGQEAISSRELETSHIEVMLISGADILEGPTVWKGEHFPIIPVWGKKLNVDGEIRYRGIIRHARDSQRMYNYWRSKATEQVALAPVEPWVVTDKMVENYQTFWKNSDKGTSAFLPWTPDDRVPGAKPYKNTGAQIPTGLHAESEYTAEEMKRTTGVYDAALGDRSNEKSGEAIKQRRLGSDRTNYAYHDNLAASIAHTGRVILDLIPHIYDSARVIRILGMDGTESYTTINSDFDMKTGGVIENPVIMEDIGRYDVTVSTGPSYTTKMQEAYEMILSLIEKYPESAPILATKVPQFGDWPYADDISDMLRAILPPDMQMMLLKQSTGDSVADDPQAIEQYEQLQAMMEAQQQAAQGEAEGEAAEDPNMDVKRAQEQAKLQEQVLDNEIKGIELQMKTIERIEKEFEAKQARLEYETMQAQAGGGQAQQGGGI